VCSVVIDESRVQGVVQAQKRGGAVGKTLILGRMLYEYLHVEMNANPSS
jgi:hypothetical protein